MNPNNRQQRDLEAAFDRHLYALCIIILVLSSPWWVSWALAL